MAKKAYIGVDGVARKIKKGYVGVDGKARKIKKAYIGIGGVARPCWSGGELTYYGTITTLSKARTRLAATTIGNYALFGGGCTVEYSVRSAEQCDTVDAYNYSLTRSKPTALSEARNALAATTVGNYALFGGGTRNYSSPVVDTYNASLTKGTASALSVGRGFLAATTVGDYALFGGGTGDTYSVVDAYNSSLSRSTPSKLLAEQTKLAAASVGDYALFSGGSLSDGNYSNTVTAYNRSLTRSSPTKLGESRYEHGGATVGNYAIFAGGSIGISLRKTVYAYNKSLTMSKLADKELGWGTRGTSVEGFAVFAGGQTDNSSYGRRSIAYDESLTQIITDTLSYNRSFLAATTIGNYALFCGGYGGSVRNYAEAFTVV